ncbi:hypothetical protein KKD80_00750 [Patescibacteria group bacterium]|nr:hypothetical protein [Patescibacteria group bacterium]
MKDAYIKEKKWQGAILFAIVLDLRDRVTKVPFGCGMMIIMGDVVKEIRQLKAILEKFQRVAPVAGITKELKTFCDERGVEISSKWRIAGDA